MAVLRFPTLQRHGSVAGDSEGHRAIEGVAKIRAALAGLGIDYERWIARSRERRRVG